MPCVSIDVLSEAPPAGREINWLLVGGLVAISLGLLYYLRR